MALISGLVVRVLGRHYIVESEDCVYDCSLKGSLRIDKSWHHMTNPVAVGDRVLISPTDGDRAVIDSVVDRQNHLSRKEKGKNSREDLIAANLDLVLTVQAFADPFMNLRFADRVSVKSSSAGISSALCVNKSDLANDDLLDYLDDYYRGSQMPVFTTACVDGSGIDELKDFIKNKTVLFIGISGCGKSSLINALIPGVDLKVSEVSDLTRKGKHTTTNVTMYRAEDGSRIIDSPGLREFGIPDIEPHFLGSHFYEFSDYAPGCAFKTCTHDHEPGCAVIAAVERGDIDEGRYISYLNILESLREYERWRFR